MQALATTVARLERMIQSPAHPFRKVAGQVEPALARDNSGEEPGQTALLLVFALLVARCQEGISGHLFEVGFHSGRLADRQPTLRRLLLLWREALGNSQEASRLVRNLISQLAAAPPPVEVNPCESHNSACHHLVHLFETLMASCHGELRRKHGVYFTPQPIVAHIVRRIDRLLQTELGYSNGLLSESPKISVVDPACGSGAFLLEVIEHSRLAFRRTGQFHRWRAFAESVFPQRLVGIDLMPACCGAAKLLLEFGLAADDLSQSTSHRLLCSNSLANIGLAESLFADSLPIIIGNPPYANFGGLNHGDWIQRQLREYKSGLKEKKINLADDFIKFLRWGQYWIDQAGRGVLAMVTSNTYLTGLTHRQMRSSLAGSFDTIEILDLHGDRKKRDQAPNGEPDQNVFGIQQGVAVGIFVKSGRPVTSRRPTRITYSQLWGAREQKLRSLSQPESNSPTSQIVTLQPPHFFFVPRQKSGYSEDYCTWPRLDEIFQRHISGIQTKLDALFVGFTAADVERKVGQFLHDAARGQFSPSVPQWLRDKAKGISFDAKRICPYMVAPWDRRWVYYDSQLLGRARHSLLGHFHSTNLALVFMRQTTNPGTYDNLMATNTRVSDRVFYSAHGAPFIAPLFVDCGSEHRTNLEPTFLGRLATRLEMPFHEGDVPSHEPTFSARDVFHWLFAAMHRSDYRHDFDALLRIDFPRVPWPRDYAHFQHLAQYGRTLTQIHLDAVAPDSAGTACDSDAGGLCPNTTLHSVQWVPPDRLLVNSNETQSLIVEPATWQFRIGGYQVLARWLKQRRHRTLSGQDVSDFHRLIDAIRRALHVVEQIDRIP